MELLPQMHVDDDDFEPWDPEVYAGRGNVTYHEGRRAEVKWLRNRESGERDIGTGTTLLKGGLWRAVVPTKLSFHVFADEQIICLRGEATVEVLTTGQTVHLTRGDILSLPKGFDTTWTMSADFLELFESAG